MARRNNTFFIDMIALISFFFFFSSFYSRRVSDVLLSLVYFYLFGFLIKFFLCVLLTLCKCLEKNIKLWSHLIGDVSMTMAMTANTNAETPAVYKIWHQAHRSHGDWSVLLLLILLLLLFISLSLGKANQRNIIWSGTGGPGGGGNSHVSDVTNGKPNIHGGNQFSKIDNRHLRRLLHWLLDHHMTMNVTARFRFGTQKILRIHFHTQKIASTKWIFMVSEFWHMSHFQWITLHFVCIHCIKYYDGSGFGFTHFHPNVCRPSLLLFRFGFSFFRTFMLWASMHASYKPLVNRRWINS